MENFLLLRISGRGVILFNKIVTISTVSEGEKGAEQTLIFKKKLPVLTEFNGVNCKLGRDSEFTVAILLI
jgi:hypothetical protein